MKRFMTLVLLLGCFILSGCGQNNGLNTNLTSGSNVNGTQNEEPEDTQVEEEDTQVEEEDMHVNLEIGYDEDPLYADEHPGENTTRSYLTNMWVTNEVQAIRPITVMFPTNIGAQPQYNIGQSGILYEIMAEGGISRMMGVIQDWREMDKIGNIRSMRDYFVYAAKEWDPIAIHYGDIWYADEVLTTVDNIDGTRGDTSDVFYRSADKEAPDNAYVSASGILDYIEEKGYSLVHGSADYYQHFLFTPVSVQNEFNDHSDTVEATYIDLSLAFTVDKPYFEYHEDDGLYYRFMYGEEHVDAATGKQLSFKNIIIQNTYWEQRPDGKYLIFQMHDTTRDGWFFTNGKGIHITWKKETDQGATKYYDDLGAEIVLNTGKTMIFVVQEGKSFLYE